MPNSFCSVARTIPYRDSSTPTRTCWKFFSGVSVGVDIGGTVFLRYQIFLTKIWVESIGAGGGSIVWIDPETGLLKVGPQGAGAMPGPICYGLGGSEVTVSDADLVLGYLMKNAFSAER